MQEGVRKMPRHRSSSSRQSWQEGAILDEVRHITSLAARSEPRIVTLGPLLFFSTESGDAWVLDPEDASALCLAKYGDALESNIVETADSFSIPWNARFQIEGPAMLFYESSGQLKTVLGYPVREIERQIHRMYSQRQRSASARIKWL
jgi:hypothetical protein